ncbi:hypothetical protein [Streptomyces sp. NPDC005859]|uniref:hypothetical protein n=1 Tax=Streptomyces sp. NPDC005859 TaxID=3157170 RepID=UPI0034017352
MTLQLTSSGETAEGGAASAAGQLDAPTSSGLRAPSREPAHRRVLAGLPHRWNPRSGEVVRMDSGSDGAAGPVVAVLPEWCRT